MPRKKKAPAVREGRNQRGKGSVIKVLPNGWFQGRIRKNGKSKTFTMATEADVTIALLKWQPEVYDPQNPRLGEFLEQWWREASHRWKSTTLETYANRFAKYIISDEVLCSIRIKDLSKSDIMNWMRTAFDDPFKQRTASTNTKFRTRSILCTALMDAVKDDLIAKNVALQGGLANPPLRSQAEVVNFEMREMFRMFEHFKNDRYWSALIRFAFDSGCREAEVLGVQVQDINFKTRVFSMVRTVDTISGKPKMKLGGKTPKAVRKIELTPFTLEAIKSLITPDMGSQSYIFTKPNGELWERSNFMNAWNRATLAAGVRQLGFHSTRHTCATMLISKGIPVNLVAARLGHKDANETLRTYTHLFDTDSHLAAGVLDELFRKPTDKPTIGKTPEFVYLQSEP